MKMIGFMLLPELLRGADNASIYMLSSSHQVFSDGIAWSHYQIIIQVESGENILYWLLDLGCEPAVVGPRDRHSIAAAALSAEKAIRLYLGTRQIEPHSALIAYPKDIVLLNGSTEGLMRYDEKTNSYSLV